MTERLDFGAIYSSAVLMGVADPGALSLGQWAAIVRGWNSAHRPDDEDAAPAPSEADYEQMITQAKW